MILSLRSSKREILRSLQRAIEGDRYWTGKMAAMSRPDDATRIHIAVFVQPYLGFVLNGTKTVESRFSVNRCAPFRRASEGDVLLVKEVGGDVVGICEINAAWFYRLDPFAWSVIKRRFAKQLAIADESFWAEKEKACYASLFQIGNVAPVDPVAFVKRDRRGWVVLAESRPAELFLMTNEAPIIVISGKIGSGKTTLARALADEFDCTAVSFSDEVREEARRRNVAETRESLQRIGEDLVANDRERFCKAVLNRGRLTDGGAMVIDGLRHLEILTLLKALASPRKVAHFHILSPDEIRASRIAARGRAGEQEAGGTIHSTEIQVASVLPEAADLRVDGSEPISDIVAEISGFIAQCWNWRPRRRLDG